MMNSRVVFRTFWQLMFVLTLTSAVHSNQIINRKQYRTIENYMDPNADPCTDFYQYSCGNWESVHKNASYSDTFDLVDYEINEEYAHILKRLKRNAQRQKHFVHLVLSYYKSCMSVEEFQLGRYIDSMREYENITWPDMKAKHEDNTRTNDWLYMLAVLRRYGLNGIFISQTVLQKRFDSRHFLLDIDRPVIDDEFKTLKYSQFDLIFEYLNIPKRQKRRLCQSFEDFESKLLELYDIEDDDGFEEIKLMELEIPELKRYFKIVLNVERIDRKMNATISNRPYMRALLGLLGNYDSEFICSYLMTRFLWHLNYNGPTGFEKVACISNVREQMPLAMTWLHEQNNPILVHESESIERIFESIRGHFLKTLNINFNNFDGDVLEFLNRKLKSMQFKIGNIPRNATIDTIEEFYRNLELSDNDFYGNHLKLLRFNAQKQLERLYTTLPRDARNFYYLEDTDMGYTSTPYFLQRSNLVIMPLTLLHLPIYHRQLHDIFKYSLIGFLLAHEITHGFDDSGLDFDQYGNMEATSNFIKENHIFDGNFDCLLAKNPRVIDEKIADVSGLRWAYETYFANVTRAEVPLTWSKMQQTQLFFRNFALFFCGSISNDKELVNSTHGSLRSRMHDTVSQFPEFGNAYNCPVGSPMNPTRKCQLWR